MTVASLSDPAIVSDPYPTYAALADRVPVHWCEGLGAWAVLRHADCARALVEPRFAADRMGSILKVKFAQAALPADSIYFRFTRNVMMYVDPPQHEPLRRAAAPGFTRAAHEAYSAEIAALATELVGSIAPGELDAIEALASKLPVMAAVRVFGVPGEDLGFVVPRVEELMSYWSGPQAQPIALERLLECLTELHEYAAELVRGQRGKVAPASVIARLAAGLPGADDLAREQAVHQLVLLLIALFAPTTPGSLGSGTLAFARHPEQIARFLADHACVENAADEVVRFNASNQFTWRVAAEPLELGGVPIAAGDPIALFLGAANRDPRVFEEPDRFDLGRANSARHLSFGAGRHACLGRHIASLEIRWFFVALFARFPRLRLAGAPVWNANLEFRSLRSLPIELHA